MAPYKYTITDLEREITYKGVFEEFAFGKPSLSLPRLILIGAQPGAGKSNLAEKAKTELSKIGAPVSADIDDIRPFHPKYVEVFEDNPFKLSALINKDCWGWTSQLLLDTRHAKNNVVYQATIRNAKRVEDLVKDFQKEKFAVDLFVVAANAKQSVQGIFYRFERAIDEMNNGFPTIPRWVPIPFHNAVYSAFPQNIEYLARNAKLERIGIFDRNGNPVYLSEGKSVHKNAGAALAKEQGRYWLQPEKDDFAKAWQGLFEVIKGRPSDKLKPKWYMRTAQLYAHEARRFAEAIQACSTIVPSGLSIIQRTPYHHFVLDKDGQLIAYDRERDANRSIRPMAGVPRSPKPEPK